MVSLFLLSLSLRFWGLSRFNTLVFDEVYYAKFANNYLTQTPFFNAHPPLAQYLVAIGIWIGSHLPFGQETVNNLAGSTLSTWSYRWFNALFGSLIPPLTGAIAYQLTHRRSYALITTALMALDGLFLVESRYALSNVYIVFFGLLAQLFFLIALNQQSSKRWGFLTLAGACFGATVAAKWNGLGFLLGINTLLACAWIFRLVFKAPFKPTPVQSNTVQSTFLSVPRRAPKPGLDLNLAHSPQVQTPSPLQQLTTLTVSQCLSSLVILPLLIYFLLWLPHLQLNPEPGLWQVQSSMLDYHRNLGSGSEVHPYCAPWYTWPLLLRPTAYLYEKLELGTLDSGTLETASTPPSILPPSSSSELPLIYDVHGMGNPVLWWLSAIALLLLIGAFIQQLWIISKAKNSALLIGPSGNLARSLNLTEFWLILYIIINWSANFLPWTQITRCVFLYHYMSALVFAVMAVSWWIEKLIRSRKPFLRIMGISLIFVIAIAFIFWLPIYLGLPLSPTAWQIRMWLSSWI
ncbi:MAG: dolichyl-phosphate-mannose--protein mannosyltransferase [Microcoleaceae cyanobacterium]